MRGLRNKARQYALKLLNYRARSEKELEDKLKKKGFIEPAASSAIQYLKNLGLVNDRTFAESLKRKALNTKLFSKKGARRYILSRGIPHEIVEEVIGNDVNDDIENAKILAGKKLKTLRQYPQETVKRRVYALLMRRAYSSDTIQRVFNDKNLFKEDKK